VSFYVAFAQGLGVGMISCVPPVIVLAVAIVSTSALGGAYGVAISGAISLYIYVCVCIYIYIY